MTEPTPNMEGISPIVAVRDIAVSVAFYKDTLGFDVRVFSPETQYALVAREGAGICLLGGDDENALRATRENVSAYIWVKDLSGLWAELEPKLTVLPDGRVRAPFTQDYGMREFHVKDPDGFLMFFGENAEPDR